MEDQTPDRINLRRSMAPQGVTHDEFRAESKRYSVNRLESLSEGSDAVGASRELNSMKMAAAPSYTSPQKTRTRGLTMPEMKEVAGKTFYLIDETWIDSQVKNKEITLTLEAWSDEYFALLKKHPQLGRYFSLGEKVIVDFDGRVIEVKPSF
jgi:hypothetical protein